MEILGPMGPVDLPTNPERWGTSPPCLLSWGPIGAVSDSKIDNCGSEFGGRCTNLSFSRQLNVRCVSHIGSADVHTDAPAMPFGEAEDEQTPVASGCKG